jgi:hypothetical protein
MDKDHLVDLRYENKMDMKMSVFWDVAPCSLVTRLLTNVSEELTASIIRAT